MRKKYKVQWAGPARLDLIENTEFIADDSPASARKIVKKIRERVPDLYMIPERGRVVPELAKQGITTFREIIIPPWRVLYKIDGKVVYVEVIADGRRNLEDLLFRRIMR
jgi:toxin ParE1/3/4